MIPLLISLAFGCAPEQQLTALNDVEGDEPEYGAITGRVCDLDGYVWLENAEIYVNVADADGKIIEVLSTVSDADGYWELTDVPDGLATIYVQKGAQLIETIEVEVIGNKVTSLEEPQCLDPSTLDIAVIAGSYDQLEDMLENMQISDYTLIDGTDEVVLSAFLTNPDAMAEFDLIFFNGGHIELGVFYDTNASNEVPAQAIQNLQDYVTNGGNVYATDWSYDVIELAWPDRIDFLGADEIRDAAQLGTSQTANAAVANHSLAEFMELEDPYLPVVFDLPVWPPIVATSSTVSEHLVAEIEYRENGIYQHQAASPLLVSFNGGGGKVIFSSFRMAANDDDDFVRLMRFVMFAL